MIPTKVCTKRCKLEKNIDEASDEFGSIFQDHEDSSNDSEVIFVKELKNNLQASNQLKSCFDAFDLSNTHNLTTQDISIQDGKDILDESPLPDSKEEAKYGLCDDSKSTKPSRYNSSSSKANIKNSSVSIKAECIDYKPVTRNILAI